MLVLVLAAVYFLFFFRLTATGLLGPDEPRYASIGREMARSGDWVTPRLWGEPWFEKPALLYWMTGAAFRVGLNEDLAPRLPVALLSVAFLAFFFWIVKREFGQREAVCATAVLATCAGWIGFSHVGATDLPMSAFFSAAMLLCLPWLKNGERRWLTPTAALFGLAVLAKGLAPGVLAVPLLWFGRKRLPDWLRPAPILAFLAVAAPWYVLCALRNPGFLEDFFWKHHFSRFVSDALKHEQPVWFYLPVLVAGLFPWTPLIALLFRRGWYQDARLRFLGVWVLFGLAFFSLSVNKLPGYLLPLLPPLCALCGIALARAERARAVLTAAAALALIIPIAGRILPEALARGITHTQGVTLGVPAIAQAVVFAAVVWVLEARRQRMLALGATVVCVIAGVVWMDLRVVPELDRRVSVRTFWREISGGAQNACVEQVRRDRRYGLNYYSVKPLPDCAEQAKPLRIVEEARGMLTVR
jgi:4-amino-4-deoxy-L-arabinose transferase-like glycosyltransferase